MNLNISYTNSGVQTTYKWYNKRVIQKPNIKIEKCLLKAAKEALRKVDKHKQKENIGGITEHDNRKKYMKSG